MIAVGLVAPARAQELEPRAYRTLPKGLSFLVLSYTSIDGNVAGEPTSPLRDLEATVTIAALGYLRSFSLFGRSASVSLAVPYSQISGSATFMGERISGTRSGSNDTRLGLAVNLLGGPALSVAEYAEYRQGRNLGVSFTVAPPTGDYDPTRIINIGTNRWAFKPEIGYSSIRGRWIFEGAAGVWFFTDNDNALGARREQHPITSLQAHLSYNFGPPGLWLSFDANYFSGGRTTLDGHRNSDVQKSSRVGLAMSVPIRRGHSLKLAYHLPAFVDGGADFEAATVAYQVQWGSWRPRRQR